MANLEYMALLKKSVNKWNEWRRTNPQVTIDFFLGNFQGADLSGINFKGAFFYNANLIGAYLNGADFSEAKNLTCEQINSVAELDENTK